MLSAAVLYLALHSCLAGDGNDWNYQRGGAEGPDNWFKTHPLCKGPNNSPINFDQTTASDKPAWKLTGWDKPNSWSVINKYSTVEFKLENEGSIFSAGGKLGMDYKLLQFHFHWGSNDKVGSEHTVKGESYPLEVHFVHKKASYSSIGQALSSGDDDALAVLGFFFQIEDQDNPALDEIIDGVLEANSTAQVPGYEMDALLKIFGKSVEGDFWRYMGSLTTPTCNEQVIWTVFKTPVGISHDQLQVFRDTHTAGFGNDLFRPVMPIGDRKVISYEDIEVSLGSSESAGSQTAIYLSLLSLLTLPTILCH